jgi:hypothetical protein
MDGGRNFRFVLSINAVTAHYIIEEGQPSCRGPRGCRVKGIVSSFELIATKKIRMCIIVGCPAYTF